MDHFIITKEENDHSIEIQIKTGDKSQFVKHYNPSQTGRRQLRE